MEVNFWVSLLGSTGMILGAAYMLWLYRRIIFGSITRDDLRAILDLSPREIGIFVPLIALTLLMGIYPTSFTSFFDATVGAMVEQHVAALKKCGPTGWSRAMIMNWTLAVPEIVLALCAMAILIFGVLWKNPNVSLACTMLGVGRAAAGGGAGRVGAAGGCV